MRLKLDSNAKNRFEPCFKINPIEPGTQKRKNENFVIFIPNPDCVAIFRFFLILDLTAKSPFGCAFSYKKEVLKNRGKGFRDVF